MNGKSVPTRAVPRPKGNLLSTYLVSDEEDDPNDDSADDLFSTGTVNERIEVLAKAPLMAPTLSTSSRRSTFDSTGCDLKSNSDSSSSIDPSRTLPSNLWSDDTIDASTPRRSQYRVTFEIIRARTITALEKVAPATSNRNRLERRNRYVSYTVLIKRVPGLETKPAVIERRYTDFQSYYTAIKRRYPLLLKDVVFPKKILIGNFSAEVIASRSVAFQSFLAYSLSVPEIRSSKEFAAFLYYPELQEAKRCLQSIHLEEAANIFENVYFILDKLAVHSGKPSAQLVHTLCCLTGCLNALDNTVEAKRLALRTFEILFENSVIFTPNSHQNNGVCEVTNLYESSELVLPLILLSLRLRWFTGQQKLSLENKLEELCRLRSLPRNFDSQPTLLEIILKRDFNPILD